MNYCKRKNEPTDTVQCLNCEHCLPPGERIGGRMCRDDGQDALSGLSNTVFVGTKEQLEKNEQKGLYRIELTDEDKAEMGKRKGYQVTMKMDFTKQPRKAMEILDKMTWRDDMSKHEMVRCKIYQTIYKLMEESEGPNLAIDYATGEPFWKYWDMMAEQMPEINEYK